MSYVLTGISHFQEEIRKSRFITIAAPISDSQTAHDFLRTHSDPAATHNCWAWVCGAQYRFNDDGEPGGTAGRPILSAIQNQGFDNTAVLVIRYYGGIQLGTGGLARAYGGGANKCLQQAARTTLIPTVTASCHIPFAEVALIKSRLIQWQALIQHEEYDATGVQLTFALPLEHMAAATTQIRDLSRGLIELKIKR